MQRRTIQLAGYCLFATSTLSISSGAAPYFEKRSINAAAAEKAIAACKAYALKNHYAPVIVVIDEAGNEVAFLKMDGAEINIADFARQKARTALRFQHPSTYLQERIDKGRNEVLTWGMFTGQGGLPIKVDDKIIGAIGVSGSGQKNDEACAQIGIDAALKP